MFKKLGRSGIRLLSTKTATPSVWVITDGGIESTLQAMSLGKQLAYSNQLNSKFKLKTIIASKKLQLLPPIIQKYLVSWSVSKQNKSDAPRQLPWYLSSSDEDKNELNDSKPDYIVSSGQDAIPACLYLSNLNKKSFSVFVGYPNLPFINFDQVVLPKYEANAKMAALGLLAKQKNGIITPAPLLDTSMMDNSSSKKLDQIIPKAFSSGYTSVIIGGHHPSCRWYSEDVVNLADNIKRMVQHLNDKIMVVFTERTPDIVKQRFIQRINDKISLSVSIWDSSKQASAIDKITTYESIIQNSNRVVLTADLDYACAHAISKEKPVYIAFSGQCRSYLSHFHRWLIDSNLERKLRLDRNKQLKKHVDDYSYLGNHATWGDAAKVLQIKNTMNFVTKEIETIREEKTSNKRRK